MHATSTWTCISPQPSILSKVSTFVLRSHGRHSFKFLQCTACDTRVWPFLCVAFSHQHTWSLGCHRTLYAQPLFNDSAAVNKWIWSLGNVEHNTAKQNATLFESFDINLKRWEKGCISSHQLILSLYFLTHWCTLYTIRPCCHGGQSFHTSFY